jgi:Trk-type K+ transport system membrane component
MIRDFRERVNLALYDSKERVLGVFRILHVLVSLGAVGVLVYYYGFPHTPSQADALIDWIQYAFVFYILRSIIRIIYDFNPLQLLKDNLFEFIVLAVLIVEVVTFNLTGGLIITHLLRFLGMLRMAEHSQLFIQFFFLIYIITTVVKNRSFKPWLKIHPGLLFTISIGSIILIGTGLLMLPEMTIASHDMSFVDALFTATSATSVTGLTTIDLASMFTFKGQIVVLFLIKLGGLNTIAFGALYLLIAKFGVGLKHHGIVEDFVNKDSLLNTGSMFGKIVVWSLGIELVGVFLLFMLVEPVGIYADTEVRLYHSIFHAISGFNNAGISILPDGMMNAAIVGNYLYHSVILGLFFLGGFGMIYLFDLFEPKRLRERMKTPWKTIEFGTKISLYYTIGLLVIGAIVFFFAEYNNTLSDKKEFGKIITSFYESMTTRNAGFNIVDTSNLALPTTIFFLFLMFVGASSGSAGGGIRTSTFAILLASVVSTIRGKANTELFKRTISTDLVMKSYSILLFFIFGNLVGPFVLSITELESLQLGKFTFMDIVFEHVSASCTVGLSTGITSELTSAGKFVLVVAMFIGRVGTLTLAFLLGKEVLSKHYKYPSGHTMVG